MTLSDRGDFLRRWHGGATGLHPVATPAEAARRFPTADERVARLRAELDEQARDRETMKKWPLADANIRHVGGPIPLITFDET